ncbi:MAG: hypothetical protein AAFY06_09960 [Pseudomonadota bacterium]
MEDLNDDDVLIAIKASQARRWLGISALFALGVLFLALVFEPAGGVWRFTFLVLGGLAFFAAERLRYYTGDTIELTRKVIRTANGRHLAYVDNVKAVERGAFAFKPSNGFLVRLHKAEGRGWAPGLWWQRGRLLGVGGVIPGGQSRAMAELLSALLQEQVVG